VHFDIILLGGTLINEQLEIFVEAMVPSFGMLQMTRQQRLLGY
jgi:hypothetical protein